MLILSQILNGCLLSVPKQNQLKLWMRALNTRLGSKLSLKETQGNVSFNYDVALLMRKVVSVRLYGRAKPVAVNKA